MCNQLYNKTSAYNKLWITSYQSWGEDCSIIDQGIDPTNTFFFTSSNKL